MNKKHYLIFSISIVLIIQSFVTVSSTLENQAIVNSSYSFDNFTESNCRGCHSSGVVDRHHLLAQAGTYGCINCHPVVTDSNGEQTTTMIRDCTQCHGTIFNNMTIPLPHQKCISCHVDNTYNISNISVVDRTAFSQGGHVNINTSDGSGQVNDSDCWTCHFNKNMNVSNSNISRCENCHTGAGQFEAPVVSEHNENGQDIKTTATCILCHSNNGMYLNNNGTNGTTTAIGHYIKEVTDTATTPYQHNGPINTSNCIDCHNGAYTNNSSWGSPVNISTSTKRNHTETQTSQCDLCHNDGGVTSLALVDFHNASVQIPPIDNCLGCHTTVTSADLGLHSTLNNTSAVENGDCKTCHHDSFPMVKGAVNNSNTYFCADCHTPGSTNPKNSSIKFTDKKHGEATCIDCHIADGTYHQDNPRGSVANPAYVSRYNSTNTITTDCADCHTAANLDDTPFNAPGGGTHIPDYQYNGTGSCTGGCHGSGTIIAAFHSIDPLDSATKKPYISTPALDYSTVTQGAEVNITVTVNFTNSPTGYGNALVDGAQYRIMSGLTEIRPWTPMTASDGNFNSSIREVASGRIDTNNLSGTYNIEVRGMGGGPAQNNSTRYYPMNGDVSITKIVNLTVIPPMGYINGTVYNATGIADATVNATNANTNINYSTNTSESGFYSLPVSVGNYNLIVTKEPEYYSNTSVTVNVTQQNPIVIQDIELRKKPTGNITGNVTNA